MGQHQYTKLYRRIELDLMFVAGSGETTGIIDWTFRTERPGTIGMQDRENGTIEFATASLSKRQPRRIILPQGNRGRMFQLKLAPRTANQAGTGALYLFGGRIYSKLEHPHQDTTWQWEPLPIPGTSDTWQTVGLPIPPTPETWGTQGLPIPQTSDVWQGVRIPIPPTPDTWQQVEWPFRQTPLEAQWVELPVDA